LEATENVKWFINDNFLAQGESITFAPEKSGLYQIKAESFNEFQETIIILINE